MIGDSFWTLNRPVRFTLFIAVLAMVVAHLSELFGLMDATTLVFGWVSAQIAYDVAYVLVGVIILAVMYLVAPEPPFAYEPTVEGDEEDSSEEAARTGASSVSGPSTSVCSRRTSRSAFSRSSRSS